ncbi:MAG: gliding motility-associated C-terminal domain-containing protein [Bacteroidetes bacterium]|nr:MAG: gliding motility-associated C-terminal domain-containing protein [Bacteroidota bacterium]
MYKLDIPSLELTQHCTMPFKPMSAAFEGENTLPPCDWLLDLDTQNDTTLVRYDTICSDALHILDEDILLTPNLEFDSLVIQITNPLDGMAESLTLSGDDSEVSLRGNDSQRIVLASTGFTKGSQMLALLPNLTYINSASIPTIGWRYIDVILYHPFHGELTARIALYISSGNNDESRYEAQSCEGTSIEVAGLSYRRDTIFQLLLANQFGCDSLVQVQLNFADTFAQQFSYQLCSGEDIMIADQVIGVDTNFTLNLQSITGCDSTLYYEVIIEEALSSTVEASICAGEAYPFAGEVYNTAGTYVDTLQASNGCDSLHFLELTVNPLPTPNIETNGNLCQGATVELTTATMYANYQWDNGSTASSVIATDAGTYGLAVTDSNGCSGTTSVELSNTPPVIIYEILQPNCTGETGTLLIEEINEGTPPYSIAGQVIEAGQLIPGFTEGIHEVIVTSSDQCETSIRFTVFPGEVLEVELLPSIDIEVGQPIQMPIFTNNAVTNVLWSPANGLSCTDCLMPTVNPLVTTIYEVVVTDDQGCEWVGTIEVKVPEVTLYVPNAFSPNLDNINEIFIAYPTELVESIWIYDRWGAQVFLSEEGTIGWGGRINGKPAAEGVYVYIIEWSDTGGVTRVASGEVTLIR